MSKTKKIVSVVLIFTLLLTMLSVTASAETKDNIPTKVRLFDNWNESAIKIELGDARQSINNIKTNNKNLFAMLTELQFNSEQGAADENSNYKNSYTIGLRCKKNGTYTVNFDIVDNNKNKIETKEIKIYAYESPLKSITFDGKLLNDNELIGKSAKVKVALNAGNIIKKLQYGVYEIVNNGNEKQSQYQYKEFKNEEEVTFGVNSYYYSFESINESDNSVFENKYFNHGMEYPTMISITYYDKYTEQNETYTQYYYKLVE